MKTRAAVLVLLLANLLAVAVAAVPDGAAFAKCYNQQQTPIPCPPTKTPVPPPATSTPTATETVTPADTPALPATATAIPQATPASPPTGDTFPWPVIDGRLLPPWLFVVGGLWLVGLIGFLLLWLFGGNNPGPNDPIPPAGKQRSRRPSKRTWRNVTVMWLVAGGLVVGFHQGLSGLTGPVCGVDEFPDWTVKSIDVKKNDDIVVTVANLGVCPAQKAVGHWSWGKTKVDNPYVDPCVTTVDAAPGMDPTPAPMGTGPEGSGSFIATLMFYPRLPALASGETTTFTVHIDLSYFYITHGESKFGYIVNCPRLYKESDYYNNSLVVP